jgi:hypothetical protein
MIATPNTAMVAGMSLRMSKSVYSYPFSLLSFTLEYSATIATKMQFNEHITQALLGVVVINPTICPK